jgi:hypothetical protein
MPLTELSRPTVRPRGGVSKVELIPAPEWAGAGSSAQQVMATWAFGEDRAHYSERMAGESPLAPLIIHSLELELPAVAASRAAVALMRAVGYAGFVARVTLASGERIVAGWSPRFGVLYPLRLVAAEIASGRTPADEPTIALKLESTDGTISENG